MEDVCGSLSKGVRKINSEWTTSNYIVCIKAEVTMNKLIATRYAHHI